MCGCLSVCLSVIALTPPPPPTTTPVYQTALLVAVTANHPEIVQDLLSLGADINACDVKGQTALHLAATYGFPRVMQVNQQHCLQPKFSSVRAQSR